MKGTLLVAVALALLASTSFSADSNPAASLKLTIVGPRAIHRGQNIKFKAVLTNSSLVPVVLPSRDTSLDFDLRWTITDPDGVQLLGEPFIVFACPVGDPGWNKDLARRLQDSDLLVLQPGDKLEFVSADISADSILARRGSYQVFATYDFVPPRIDGGDGAKRDSFGQRYDLTSLSPDTLEMLKHAATVRATSTFTLVVPPRTVGGKNNSPVQQAVEGKAALELVLSGPEKMPLFRRGRGVTFHAVLVNRSQAPVTLVRPHKEWFEEHPQWSAFDERGRSVERLPTYQMECLPLPTCPSVAPQPLPIRDDDLLVLKPGESYEIVGLYDPSFSLKFLNRGVYHVSLAYTFDPSHYRLPESSRKSEALKGASFLSVASNALQLRIN